MHFFVLSFFLFFFSSFSCLMFFPSFFFTSFLNTYFVNFSFMPYSFSWCVLFSVVMENLIPQDWTEITLQFPGFWQGIPCLNWLADDGLQHMKTRSVCDFVPYKWNDLIKTRIQFQIVLFKTCSDVQSPVFVVNLHFILKYLPRFYQITLFFSFLNPTGKIPGWLYQLEKLAFRYNVVELSMNWLTLNFFERRIKQFSQIRTFQESTVLSQMSPPGNVT